MKWLLIMLLGLGAAVQAQEANVVTAVEPVRELHVFGGVNLPVELIADGPLGTSTEVRADLWQLTGSLAAPLRKDFEVSEKSLDFSGATPRVLRRSVPLPEVQRITRMALRFRVRQADDPSWLSTGNMALNVYPKESAQWYSFTHRADARLAVFGPADSPFRSVLKAHGVKYEDLGRELPGELPESILVAGEMGPVALQDWLGGHAASKGALVILCSDPDGLPVISIERRPGFCLTKIATALLGNLSTDPLAGETLAATLNRALDIVATP